MLGSRREKVDNTGGEGGQLGLFLGLWLVWLLLYLSSLFEAGVGDLLFLEAVRGAVLVDVGVRVCRLIGHVLYIPLIGFLVDLISVDRQSISQSA